MTAARPPDPARVFLVGCPRSGTTLLQSLLFAHPDVVSLPETFFFMKVVPGRFERVRRHLRLASERAPSALRDLDALGVPADPSATLWPSLTVGGYSRRFLRRMDAAAHEAGASLWLEKTPRHARHVKVIQAHIPDAQFVHIVRAGQAVVASLRDASDADPDVWPSATPLELVEVWRRYVRAAGRWVGRPNHAYVSYERLAADPRRVTAEVLRFLNLRGDEAMLDEILAGYAASSQKLIGRVRSAQDGGGIATEPWKVGTDAEITNRNDAKFQRLFSAEERAAIDRAVAEQDAALGAIPFI